jgi:thioredoxin reductase (NADPH)
MFDYDSRPVTPQVVLVGTRSSPEAYAIRDFLTRNGRPYEWVDADALAGAGPAVQGLEIDLERLPTCILPDGTRLAPATIERVASGLGMIAEPVRAEYDLAIVGAGPSGLAAAVYATSEGLSTAVVEAVAPGGQAGTTSMIENYLGFPNGISGSELANRAVTQARRFGAEILLARRLSAVKPDGSGQLNELSDGAVFRSRALLFATGVEWRRLEVPGIEELLGAGVYYGAGPSEAIGCQGTRVAIVGGGNSAGQAAVRFSRYAREVTLLVRGRELGASMSQYLIDRISRAPNIEVRTGTEVVGFEAGGQLGGLVLSTGGSEALLPTDSLFICIGGAPRTEGLSQLGVCTDSGGYIVTGSDLHADSSARWPAARDPYPLETSLPGVFAAGDVRHGSIKRCSAAIGEGSMAVALVHRHLSESADD